MARDPKLDDRVTFLQRINVRDAKFRTDQASWVPFDEVWAEVQDVLPANGDRIAEGIDITLRPCRITVRWRDDIAPDMRLRVDGRADEYRIVAGPIEIGRRHWLEMTAQSVSTEGQRP